MILLQFISSDSKQESEYINLRAKPFVPGVSEASSTPEPEAPDPNATGDATSCAPGRFPSAMETSDEGLTLVENALEREECRRGTLPGVAGLATGSDEFSCFFEKQKQRMAVI